MNRDRHDRRHRDSDTPFEVSCFWWGGKGHTLFECPETPPNSKVKTGRDMVDVVKSDKTVRFSRNEGRQFRSVHVSDDEDEDYEEDTFAKIQVLFEPTKR